MSLALSLDDLLIYARCPLEWYWEKQAGVAKPYTPDRLVPAAVRQAIAYYYAGHADSIGIGVGLVWRDWCEGWGDGSIAEELARYQEGRARILAEFEKGNITRPDGSLYAVPQMTHEYRNRIHRAGLLKVSRRLDEFASAQGIILPGAGESIETSTLGDAYADCVMITDRLRQVESLALPAREVVLGVQTPYQVRLGAFDLTGRVDLVVQVGPTAQAGEGAVVLEVHDYGALRRTLGAAVRDLRVIAASLSRSVESGAVTWQVVDQVVYRHMHSGQAFVTRSGQADPGRLLAVVAAVARGMRSGLIVPRALTSPLECRACAYHPRCFTERGWDMLDLVDPTTTAQAVRLADILHRVRETIAGDGRVAEQARRALAIVEQGVRHELPDLVGGFEILAEVRQALNEPARAEAQRGSVETVTG